MLSRLSIISFLFFSSQIYFDLFRLFLSDLDFLCSQTLPTGRQVIRICTDYFLLKFILRFNLPVSLSFGEGWGEAFSALRPCLPAGRFIGFAQIIFDFYFFI
jgi:hypothetical protein